MAGLNPIYAMQLHDVITVGDYEILRCAHGWVYSRKQGALVVTSVFVPYTAGVDQGAEI